MLKNLRINKMKETEEFEDNLVSDFVKSEVRTLSNKDFEHDLMLQIKNEVNYKNEVASYLKKAIVFFLISIVTGVLFIIGLLFGEYDAKSLAVLILFGFSIVGFLCIENYRVMIKNLFSY